MLSFRPPVRATKTLRPIIPTQAQANALASLYTRVLSVWDVSRLTSVYSATRSEMMHDSVADIEVTIEQMASNAIAAIFNFRALFENWLGGIVKWHVQKFAANLKYATNVDLSSVIGPAPADTLQAAIARNVALVRNVSDKARQDISEIIFRGLSQRTPVEQVAREIRDAIGSGRARSRRIAGDQLTKISAALDTSRANDLGLTTWEWKHSGKVHFRPWHKARDGKIYDDTDLPSDVVNDQPGFAPFCFPSWQPVAFHDDVLTIWKRPYSGHLTKIVTSSNEVLDCTPNHPILTIDGWKTAKEINIGDYVVHSRASGIDVPDVDVEKRQTSIGNLFEACETIFGSVSIDGSGSDFHGDGLANHQINVVNTEGGLRRNLVAASDQDALQFFLEKALLSPDAVECLASFDFLKIGDFALAGDPMSRLNLIDTLLWSELGPLDFPSLAIAANLDAFLFKFGDKRWSRYSILARNGIGAFSGKIIGDGAIVIKLLSVTSALRKKMGVKTPPLAENFAKMAMAQTQSFGGGPDCSAIGNHIKSRVESIVSDAWRGHVYNFQTKSGWYSAGTIAVHNCGCKKRYRLNAE